MKNLSKAQQKVIDLLKENQKRYILKSQYYNHQDVIFEEEHKKRFFQFKKPTFEVLEKLGLIVNLEGNKYILK